MVTPKGSHTFNQSNWEPQFFELSPLYAPVSPFAAQGFACHTAGASWPSLADYNASLKRMNLGLMSGGGSPLRCVKQPGVRHQPAPGDPTWDVIYQLKIFLTGEVPTRAKNWHDFFNLLVWCAFPKSKAALNRRHFFAFDETSPFPWAPVGGNRSKEQDLLTLFDEGGLIVPCADPRLWHLCETSRWKELFWENRKAVEAGMRFYAFGHAIYEVTLGGHPCPHASALMIPVSPSFMTQPLLAQLAFLDDNLALLLGDRVGLKSSRALTPVPVLGFPGFTTANANAAYYDNASYFRAGRQSAMLLPY